MLKAIIFDMDGTLTVPYINWQDLRAKIECPSDKNIIEHIDSLPPDLAQPQTYAVSISRTDHPSLTTNPLSQH
jgi:hypothetical protein